MNTIISDLLSEIPESCESHCIDFISVMPKIVAYINTLPKAPVVEANTETKQRLAVLCFRIAAKLGVEAKVDSTIWVSPILYLHILNAIKPDEQITKALRIYT